MTATPILGPNVSPTTHRVFPAKWSSFCPLGPEGRGNKSLSLPHSNPELVKHSDVCVISGVQFFSTPWTVARQAPLSMGFSRQEYWSGLPCPPPGDLPDPGIKPQSLVSPTLASGFFTMSATREALNTEISPPNPLLSRLNTPASLNQFPYTWVPVFHQLPLPPFALIIFDYTASTRLITNPGST